MSGFDIMDAPPFCCIIMSNSKVLVFNDSPISRVHTEVHLSMYLAFGYLPYLSLYY